MVLDYFNSTLYDQIVDLRGLDEYSVYIQAYTLIVNNLYKNQTITIEITRGNITIERLIEAQGWTEFKLFPNIEYEVFSYIDGVKDEERDVKLEEEYMVVDFGFFEADIQYNPDPLAVSLSVIIAFVIILAVGSILIVISWAYMKHDRDEIPKRTRDNYKAQKWKVGTFKNEGL